LFIGESGFLQGREVTKRAESSSFAKGRLEPKAAPTVTSMTQELLAVILEQKSYNPRKSRFSGPPTQKIAAFASACRLISSAGDGEGGDLFAFACSGDIAQFPPQNLADRRHRQ
jgi:hypothetical protein